MPNYRVHLSDTIEADSQEQAVDIFLDKAESGEYNIGDCDVDEE